MMVRNTDIRQEDIVYERSNTWISPDSGTTSGSRQTLVTGEACRRACEKLMEDRRAGKELKDMKGIVYYGEYLAKTDPLGANEMCIRDSYKELSDNPHYQEWIDSNGTLPFPGGESKEECADRNLKGFDEVLKACRDEGITEAALVVHGGTIMNIMEAYALPKKAFYEWHVGNGCGYLVELELQDWNDAERHFTQVTATANK